MIKTIYHILFILCLSFSPPVKANQLTELKQEFSDSVITTKITAQFAEHPLLNPLKISIDTHHGVVELIGYVGTKEGFVDALRIAKNTKGVHSVDAHQLYIKKVNTSFTDAFITAQVETAVLKAKVLDDESIPLVGINASTSNGVVTLTGALENTHAISSIIKHVNSIRGVKKIISRLEVKAQNT